MVRRYGLIIILLCGVIAAGIFLGQTLATAQERQRIQAPAATSETGFTYEGQLEDGGLPAHGEYDFQFKLYDDQVAGSQVGSTISASVHVEQGHFHTTLDFGPDAFDGTPRFLETAVQLSGGGGFTTLTPRQEIGVLPYAIYASELLHPPNILTVAKANGDYSSVSDALAAISDASAANPYIIRVAPGVYSETIQLKSYVDIEGGGKDITILRGGGSPSDPLQSGAVLVSGTVTSSLRLLTIEGSSSDLYVSGLVAQNVQGDMRVEDVWIRAAGALLNYGLYLEKSEISFDGINIDLQNSMVDKGIFCGEPGEFHLSDSQISLAGADDSAGIVTNECTADLSHVTIDVDGGTSNVGVFVVNSSATLDNVIVHTTGITNRIGIEGLSSSMINISQSDISADDISIKVSGDAEAGVELTRVGQVLDGPAGDLRCIAVYTPLLVPLGINCDTSNEE